MKVVVNFAIHNSLLYNIPILKLKLKHLYICIFYHQTLRTINLYQLCIVHERIYNNLIESS